MGRPGNGYPNGYPNDPRRADEQTVRITGHGTPPVGPPQMGPPQFGQPQYGPPQYGPPGPGWPPHGPPPPGSNRLKWFALSAAVLAVVAVTAAIVFSVRGGDKPAPSVAGGDATTEAGAAPGSNAPTGSPSTVDLKGLEALLPPSAELLTTLGVAPTMQVRRGDSAIDGKYSADEFKCSPSVNPFDAAGLRGSGYTAVRFSKVRDPEAKDVATVQAVWVGGTMFQTADAAAARFDKLKATLDSCAGKTVNLKQDGDAEGEDSFWVLGKPATDGDGVVSLVNTPEGGGEWRCTHAAAVRNNVLVEAVDCKNNQTTDRAVSLVKQMTAKIAAPQ